MIYESGSSIHVPQTLWGGHLTVSIPDPQLMQLNYLTGSLIVCAVVVCLMLGYRFVRHKRKITSLTDTDTAESAMSSWVPRRKTWVLIFAAAFLVRIILAPFLMHDWDGFVFTESAKNMLQGITPYQTVESNDPMMYPDSDRPMTQQWYGYPPVPLIMFTIPYALAAFLTVQTGLWSILGNVAIKLPFILGDLLCAYLMMAVLWKYDKRWATRAGLLILFNPLLIWISAAWGMFDIWIVNFLLLFLLSVRSKNAVLAGMFLFLAPQVKLFPVFFLPALILFFFQKISDTHRRIQFAVAGIVTTLLIDVPFFLSSPQGFLNQNLVMHLSRPPQGIGPVGILDYFFYIYDVNIAPIVTMGALCMLAGIVLFNLFSLAYVQGRESRLVVVMLLIYTSTLLFNKVVNEQYYVVLVSLLILLVHFPDDDYALLKRKFFVVFEATATYSVLIAAVVLGFHFLTFLPYPIATTFFKASTNDLVYYLSSFIPQLPLHTYPNSLWTYYHAPITLTFIILLPLIALSAVFVGAGAHTAYRMRREIKDALISVVSGLSMSRLGLVIALMILALITLSTPSLYFYLRETHALELVDLVDARTQAVFPAHPRVGAFYNVWWNNVSHLPEVPDTAWSKTTLAPEVGYYTSKNSLYARHIKQMKEAGIDFAVVSYHLYDRERYLTFGMYAEKMGLYYSPLLELGDILSDKKFHDVDSDGNTLREFSMNQDSAQMIKTYLLSAIEKNYASPALLRIDGKPVVFIRDGHLFSTKGDEYITFWLAIRHEVENEVGPIYLMSTYATAVPNEDEQIIKSDTLSHVNVFDNEFSYSLSDTWRLWRTVATPSDIMNIWEQQQKEQAQRSLVAGHPVFASVTPMYNDTLLRGALGFDIPASINGMSIYDRTWQQAQENHADYVLIATWNEFFEGSAIEPSKEYASYYLEETKKYAEALKRNAVNGQREE